MRTLVLRHLAFEALGAFAQLVSATWLMLACEKVYSVQPWACSIKNCRKAAMRLERFKSLG
jgi:hypothetical protein